MIRLRTITLAAVSAFIATVTAAGCGSSGDSGFNGGGDGNGNPGGGDGGPGSGGNVNGGGDASLPGADPGNVGNVSNCATQTASSTLTKVNLITMFDKSGSMGDGTSAGNNYNTRWAPVTKAMNAFYSDPKSAGMNASLQFYPTVRDQDGNTVCVEQFYRSQAVAITSLPSNAFSNAIENTDPGGGTPTELALKGAVYFTKETLKERPTEKAVILLVTDGQPNDCKSTNDAVQGVANVATSARTGTPSISTYVIGVGGDQSTEEGKALYAAVDKMAAAGGTQGIHVDVGDPEKTSSDLVAQLQKIRGANLSCSFAIPKPPGGGTINYDAVRVNFTSGKNVASTVPYSETCTGNNGWHYDNKAAPKNIVLCTNTCNTIQGDPGGKINIAFDCKGTQADGGSGGVH